MYKKYSLIISIFFIIISILVLVFKDKKNTLNEKTGFNKYNILFIAILIIFIFTRLYHLTDVPYGMHVDEAAMYYNAYSLAEANVDRYQNIMPIYPINFNGGQSPMYSYLAALVFGIFGYRLLLGRLIAVIFGFLTLIYGYKLGCLLKDKKLGLLTMFIIAISPYFIMSSRWGLDCNLMLGLFTISVYYLLKAVTNKKIFTFIIAGICFGLTLYTYALSYIILPIILFILLIYLIYTKSITFKEFFAFSLPLFLLALPMIINVFVQFGFLDEIKTNYISIIKLQKERTKEVGLSNIIPNLKKITSWFTHDDLIYNAFPRFGTLYLFSLPVFILGLILSIKNSIVSFKDKKFNKYTYLNIILFMFILAISLTYRAFCINHANAIYIILAIYLSYGLYNMMNYLNKYKFIIIPIYFLAFTYFNYYYFVIYPIKINPQRFFINTSYTKAVKESIKYNTDIYTEAEWNGNLIVALENRISPFAFDEEASILANYHFYIPDSFNDEAIYIVKENNHQKLIKNNFTCQDFNEYYLCLKSS